LSKIASVYHVYLNSLLCVLFQYESHTKKFRLIDLIDEYVDHLNYLQDIFMLNNQALSECLSEQLIRRLFIPVFLSSLYRKEKFATKVGFHKN
jgi:hypothetical protein